MLNQDVAPTVSIVLATYNGESYLEEQLKSISLQDYPITEVVIADDCSTDSTPEICKDFAQRVSFNVIIVRNTERLGYSHNFFRGLSHCNRGEIVFFCDQDDWWEPNKVSLIVKHFRDNPKILLTIHDVEFCDENLTPVGYTKLKRMQPFSNPYFSYITGMATAMRRELVELALPMPENAIFSYDGWLHRLAVALDKKSVLPHVLARYRRHDKNVTVDNSLNAATKQVRSHYAIKKLQSSIEFSLMRQLEIWTCVTERLSERLSSDDSRNSVVVKRALKFKENVRWRLRTREKAAYLRIPIVVFGFLVGRYRQFSGISSTVKDLKQREVRKYQ